MTVGRKDIAPRADLRVRNEGTVLAFDARTERGLKFLREELHTEPWQWLGNQRLVVDHRPARDVLALAVEAGLSIEEG